MGLSWFVVAWSNTPRSGRVGYMVVINNMILVSLLCPIFSLFCSGNLLCRFECNIGHVEKKNLDLDQEKNFFKKKFSKTSIVIEYLRSY